MSSAQAETKGLPKYALISAVRNEAGYLEELIASVAAQTVLPECWCIVDDGSADATFAMAREAQARHSFITAIQMPVGRGRSFSSQVHAAQHGFSTISDRDFDTVGFLDADIRMDPLYYEQQLRMMVTDPTLGLVGGAVMDQHACRLTYVRRGSEDYHVPGGVQFFRRECFEAIGGYHVIDGGGQDTIADIMTMMHGWRVRVNLEAVAIHLRPEGVDAGGALRRGMRWGRKFYLLGYHPLYFLGQCARRWNQPPIFLAAFFQLFGFAIACARREARPVSAEFIAFLRALQMRRIRVRLAGDGLPSFRVRKRALSRPFAG